MLQLLIILTSTGGFLGGYTPEHFAYCMFFAILGTYISLNMEANKRNVHSSRTPVQFKYRVLIEDNWQRILFNLVAIYVILRFSTEFTGKPLSEFVALGVGLCIDRIVLYFKRYRDSLKPDK